MTKEMSPIDDTFCLCRYLPTWWQTTAKCYDVLLSQSIRPICLKCHPAAVGTYEEWTGKVYETIVGTVIQGIP
jgi:hypothetical protein